MPFDASFSASASASASFDIGGSPGNSGASGGGIRIPAATQNEPENLLAPLHVFRFHIRFKKDGSEVPVCSGAFAECTGLEATMEPKQIKAGGHNYGTIQRVGRTSFATVVLKRGMTSTRDLWQWFHLVNGQTGYAYRMSVEIDMQDGAGNTVLTWGLAGALPVKFKAADLNAKGTDVGIEELHLAHEGLSLRGGA